MLEKLELLIEALREELKQYGEMLALLDQQQDLIVTQMATELLNCVAAINSQAGVIQTVREQRDFCLRQCARMLNRSDSTEFADLLPLFPEDYRPLVTALVRENNQLLFRVHQRARQNHVLLGRSLQMMQEFLNTLLPTSSSPVYDVRGSVFAPAGGSRSLYEAVG